ncbi:MAG: hypothetical protein JNL32_08875 [Candidatus Kapabacteria bacterium]|nr:hypothetical protein [Candidatus Kapabacteria bacterium]
MAITFLHFFSLIPLHYCRTFVEIESDCICNLTLLSHIAKGYITFLFITHHVNTFSRFDFAQRQAKDRMSGNEWSFANGILVAITPIRLSKSGLRFPAW